MRVKSIALTLKSEPEMIVADGDPSSTSTGVFWDRSGLGLLPSSDKITVGVLS